MAILPRALIHDLRSAFKMLEEPFFSAGPLRSYTSPYSSFLNSPLLNAPSFNNPVSNLREEGKNYLFEAEIPGYKKGDLKIEVTDNGEVLHVSGTRGARTNSATVDKVAPEPAAHATDPVNAEASQVDYASASPAPEAEVKTSEPFSTTSSSTNIVKSEDAFIPSWASERSASFSNTFRFPRSVDAANIKATLEDGILRLVIPKLEKDAIKHSIQID